MIECQNSRARRSGAIGPENEQGAKQATGTFKRRKVFETPNPTNQQNYLKKVATHFKSLFKRTVHVLSENIPEYVNIAMCTTLLKLHLYANTHEKTELKNNIARSKRKIEATLYQDRFAHRTESCARAAREGNLWECGRQVGGMCTDGARFLGNWVRC